VPSSYLHRQIALPAFTTVFTLFIDRAASVVPKNSSTENGSVTDAPRDTGTSWCACLQREGFPRPREQFQADVAFLSAPWLKHSTVDALTMWYKVIYHQKISIHRPKHEHVISVRLLLLNCGINCSCIVDVAYVTLFLFFVDVVIGKLCR